MFRKILLNIKTHQATADRRNSGAESRAQRRSDIASALWNAGHGIPCCSDPAKSATCCPKNNVRIWDWICPAAFFMVCAGPTSAKKGSPEMLHSFCGNRGHCRGNDSCLRCLKNKVDSNFLLLSASGTPWINRLTTWLHPSPSMMEAAAKISNRSREDFVYQTNNFLRRSCHYGPGQLSKQRSMRISN